MSQTLDWRNNGWLAILAESREIPFVTDEEGNAEGYLETNKETKKKKKNNNKEKKKQKNPTDID